MHDAGYAVMDAEQVRSLVSQGVAEDACGLVLRRGVVPAEAYPSHGA